MGRQERMTEQKGERSGGKAQLIPGRWEGGREGGSAGTESCFTIIAHVSVASGACLNPPGHPPAAGPHRHGKLRHGDAFRYRNSPLPEPGWGSEPEGVPGWESIPSGHHHPGQRPLGGQDRRSCGGRQRFAGTGCIFTGSTVGFRPGEGGPDGAVRLGCAGSEPDAVVPRGDN